MIFKTLMKCGFMAIFLFGISMGMDDGKQDKQLVIGCRPWDANVQGFSGLETASFVDFTTHGETSPRPSNFYHLDVNNDKMYGSGNFSDFTVGHISQFNTIIVDWATWQHIRRDGAWADFATLLQEGGSLIVPVASMNFMTKSSLSHGKAEELKIKLLGSFSDIEIIDVSENILEKKGFNFLCRPHLEQGRLQSMLELKPAIVVATKK